ncbi:MAG: NUDIX hydrolase [Umezawaea sp.]
MTGVVAPPGAVPPHGGRSVAIIGSFRQHYREVVAAARVFQARGIEVVSPPLATIINPGEDYVRFDSDSPRQLDHEIQALTMEKIHRADHVYVVAPGGYIGRTTSYELGCIRQSGKQVVFSEPPTDLPITVAQDEVASPEEFARRVVDGPASSLTWADRARGSRTEVKLTADLVVLTARESKMKVLLVERGTDPYVGKLALPGGFLRAGEDLETTAHLELLEETGLNAATLPLRQFRTYSSPDRDPRGRVVTTAFLAVAPNLPSPSSSPGTDVRGAQWMTVSASLVDRLAFDHRRILSDALECAKQLLETTTLATSFCAEEFTIAELREVYETIWDTKLDAGNFTRKVKSITGFLRRTDKRKPTSGRPAMVYRKGGAEILQPPLLRSVQRYDDAELEDLLA